MSETSDVLRFVEAAAARAEGGLNAEPPPHHEALEHARRNLRTAADHVHGGEEIPVNARLRPVKQALVSGLRPITSHQREFNAHMVAAVDGLTAMSEALDRNLEQRANQLQAAAATTDLTIDDLSATVAELRQQVASLGEAVTKMADRVTEMTNNHPLAADMAVLQARQNLIFREARAALPETMDSNQLSHLARELDTGYEQLYQDLEDTFRGTRDHVKALVSEYVANIAKVSASGPVIDVGCGRGEWIEVLRDNEIDAYGIDLNQVVVERCQARGLDVRHGDALEHLRSLPEGSVRAVTSFHLVEHLSLDTMVGLVEAALLALAPGGILIMETPNPSNLNVGASSFYLDPTHIKPVHPQFLQFLVVQRGFADAEVRYLHSEAGVRLRPEDLVDHDVEPERAQRLVDQINWALSGPLDYAVIAHKARTNR